MIPSSEILQYANALRDDMKQWVLQGFEPQYGKKKEKHCLKCVVALICAT